MGENAEYTTLRAEALQILEREHQLVTFAYTATAVIFAAGLGLQTQQVTEPLIFLAPLVVLAAVLIQLDTGMYQLLRIAVYIRLVFEQKTANDLQWETGLHRLRGRLRRVSHSWFSIFPTQPYVATTIFMGYVCIALDLANDSGVSGRLIALVTIVLWTTFSAYVWFNLRRAFSGSLERELEALWRQVLPNLHVLAGTASPEDADATHEDKQAPVKRDH
ncbi:MAG TPA: hypothetical protein VH349_00075 [Ktedonobacterales bacterium]|jgi:hypothetical protein